METQKLNVDALEAALPHQETSIAKDLRFNIKKILGEGALDAKEGGLALLALATSCEYPKLQEFARGQLTALGATPEEIAEAEQSAAIMGMLNTYYKFRYMITQGSEQASQEYGTAGLRMMSIARPVLGKKTFEMLAFTVSVLNGCQSCIVSHEKVLKEHGVSSEAIHDLARLASTMAGLKKLSTLA